MQVAKQGADSHRVSGETGSFDRSPESNRPLRILLADEAPLVRDRMQQVLQAQGYEVVCASDGFDVLCRLPEWRPDLLMLASSLPRLSGGQVCALLRQSPDFKELRVVLLSDGDNFLDSATADHVSADACLSRPFSTADLLQALQGMSSTAAQSEMVW
jgi:twitching motility two-component system response regulator PilG